jgi:mono/diheme cytochrome c family protein
VPEVRFDDWDSLAFQDRDAAMRKVYRTVLGIALVAGATPGQAQQTGDVSAGRTLAKTWCSNCHVVERQASRGSDAVPSFPAIAEMSSTTSMSLHAFLQTPHGRMPDFKLSIKQIDDVTAYILSLKGSAM